jgi:hypothetical protein
MKPEIFELLNVNHDAKSNANCPNRPSQNEFRKRAMTIANFELRSALQALFHLISARQVAPE